MQIQRGESDCGHFAVAECHEKSIGSASTAKNWLYFQYHHQNMRAMRKRKRLLKFSAIVECHSNMVHL